MNDKGQYFVPRENVSYVRLDLEGPGSEEE